VIHGRAGDVPHQLYWHKVPYIKILYERVTFSKYKYEEGEWDYKFKNSSGTGRRV